MVHPLEMLADDVEVGVRHQMMDVGHAAGDGILDRDHRQRRATFTDRGEGIIELGAGQSCQLRKDAAAGEIGIGPEGAWDCDRLLCHRPRVAVGTIWQARARSAGVSTCTPSRSGSIKLTEMRIPPSRAPNCPRWF